MRETREGQWKKHPAYPRRARQWEKRPAYPKASKAVGKTPSIPQSEQGSGKNHGSPTGPRNLLLVELVHPESCCCPTCLQIKAGNSKNREAEFFWIRAPIPIHLKWRLRVAGGHRQWVKVRFFHQQIEGLPFGLDSESRFLRNLNFPPNFAKSGTTARYRVDQLY